MGQKYLNLFVNFCAYFIFIGLINLFEGYSLFGWISHGGNISCPMGPG